MADSMDAAEIERRRARACVYVKRAYEKKKATLTTLRKEFETLEREYQALVASRDAPSRSSELLRRYNALAALKHQLYTENDALRTMVNDHMLQEARLQQVVDMYYPPLLTATPFRFRPLSLEHTRRELAVCRAKIQQLLTQPPRRTSGLKFFGWSDQRDISGNLVSFAFEKQFPNASPRDLTDRMWALMSDPSRTCAIYSASMNAQVHVLQYIDLDTVLVYWRLRPDGSTLLLKSVFLLARFAIPDGYSIVCHTIDKDAIGFDDDGINALIDEAHDPQRASRTDYWTVVNNYMLIQRVGASNAKYYFCGISVANLWAVEVLLICMRFELLALGTRLLPPTS